MTKPIRTHYMKDAPVNDIVKEMLQHVTSEELQKKFEIAYAEQIKELFEVFLVQEALNTYSHQLRVPLKALDIRPAVLTALENASIKTVADLVQYSPKELTKIPGIGPKAVEQVYAALRKEGMIK